MQWLLIGTLAGSIVTSAHSDKEACEGRAMTLREKGATVQCVAPLGITGTTGNIRFCTTSTCNN